MHKVVKKTTAKKRRRKSSDYIRLAIVLLVLGSFLYTFMSLQHRLWSIREDRIKCENEYKAKKEEYELAKQQSDANASADYYEKKARDEGYVLENEVVFVIGN